MWSCRALVGDQPTFADATFSFNYFFIGVRGLNVIALPFLSRRLNCLEIRPFLSVFPFTRIPCTKNGSPTPCTAGRSPSLSAARSIIIWNSFAILPAASTKKNQNYLGRIDGIRQRVGRKQTPLGSLIFQRYCSR